MSNPCKLGNILANATDAEKKVLQKAIADNDTWSAQQLATAINLTDYSVGATTIKDHRRRECGCFRDND